MLKYERYCPLQIDILSDKSYWIGPQSTNNEMLQLFLKLVLIDLFLSQIL